MTATAGQLNQYSLHKETCQDLGIPQATLKHQSLKGTLSAASATGVKTYTGPDPRTTAPATVDTAVWATWQPLRMTSGGAEPQDGRQGIPRLIGQMPTIDDNQAAITVAHDDTLDIGDGGKPYKILNPTLEPDGGFITFELLQRR